MKKALMYGAGNIGRGFIGQLFSQSGYEAVFVDVNTELVESMNREKSYPIKILSDDSKEELLINNIRAVNGRDIEAIASEIATADIMATAVGVNVLPYIIAPISYGIKKRWALGNTAPLNIIICENLLNANHYIENLIKKELTKKEVESFDTTIGLIQASIGRMVPVMTEELQKGNPLRICVEAYCQLPVDKAAFKGEIPDIVNMLPFSPFEYFIQNKLFIHNMGHAATAYLGQRKNYQYIWQAIRDADIHLTVSDAMQESAQALSLEHGIPLDVIEKQTQSLINRFGNIYLGDTIARVGKDPIRKLSFNDRFVGAARLCIKHGIKPLNICRGMAAALFFDLLEDKSSQELQLLLTRKNTAEVLNDLSSLSQFEEIKSLVLDAYDKYYMQNKGLRLDSGYFH